MLELDPEACEAVPGLWALGVVVEKRPGGPGGAAGLPSPRECVPDGLDRDSLKDHPTAAAYRKLSWRVGIDPTKNRPAGEALARRILGGRPLPRIHPLVDAYNLASAATLVPLGAYDLDRLAPPLVVRPARAGEGFHGIGRDPETLAPGRIVYADREDAVCGVFLWRDAHGTRVRTDSRRVLILAVGGDPLGAQVGEAALRRAADLAGRAGFDQTGDVLRAAPGGPAPEDGPGDRESRDRQR